MRLALLGAPGEARPAQQEEALTEITDRSVEGASSHFPRGSREVTRTRALQHGPEGHTAQGSGSW